MVNSFLLDTKSMKRLREKNIIFYENLEVCFQLNRSSMDNI